MTGSSYACGTKGNKVLIVRVLAEAGSLRGYSGDKDMVCGETVMVDHMGG